MKDLFRRILGAALAAAALAALLALPVFAQPGSDHETTVLFTHDLHSHFLPQATEVGGQSGGYARLATVLKEQRALHPDALTLDGGDFSVGSLIQTLYTTQAPELRTMGALGYDATTAGNHEFDHTGSGFGEMLYSALGSGDALPALLMSNYKPAADNPRQLEIQRAMSAYGVEETLVLERGGVTYGIFGLMGEDSDDCAPESGFTLEDPIQAARRCVERLEGEGAEFIIALSHSGTEGKPGKTEDERLAREVEGIDLIISGHSHTTLTEPIVVGDTYIVSSGPYCENLGSITLSWDATGEKTLVDYQLIPIDETVAEDGEIAALVEYWKQEVGGEYLGRYGLSYDQVLTTSSFPISTPEYGVQQENGLGELVSDAFLWALQQAEGEEYVENTVAVTADGVLRASLPAGEITVSQAFDVLSMGVGEDGTSGFPLVYCYLTGKELKAVLEVDASVTPLMPAAQLYLSGVEYSFNTHRMLFNRVTQARLVAPDGSHSGLRDDQLYRVVSGMYSAQMLSTVKSKSFGLLSIQPKDENGAPIEDFSQFVLRDAAGNELKEWYALAAYLKSFGGQGVPARYESGDGRKEVSASFNPIELVKNPNWITMVALLVIVLVAALVIYVVRRVFFAQRNRRYGGRRWRF